MRDTGKQALCVLALLLLLALPGCAGSALIAAQGPAVEVAALRGAAPGAVQEQPAAADSTPTASSAAGANTSGGDTGSAPAVDPAAEPQPDDSTLRAAPGLRAGSGDALKAMAVWTGLEQLRTGVSEQPVRLAVANILQTPELPNGCEITSAAIVLNYLGVPADKTVLAEKYLPMGEDHLKADPEREFMGSPFAGEVGYYCMPGPVVKAVNRYLADVGSTGLRAREISGASLTDLQAYVRSGTPVLVWVTRRFEPLRYAGHFTLPDGSMPYTNLHCVVVTGFGDGKVYLADPLDQVRYVDEETFAESYQTMGCRALVIAANDGHQ